MTNSIIFFHGSPKSIFFWNNLFLVFPDNNWRAHTSLTCWNFTSRPNRIKPDEAFQTTLLSNKHDKRPENRLTDSNNFDTIHGGSKCHLARFWRYCVWSSVLYKNLGVVLKECSYYYKILAPTLSWCPQSAGLILRHFSIAIPLAEERELFHLGFRWRS